MKILQRHILKEFGKVLIITATSLAALFLIIDMVETADELVEHGVGLVDGIKFFLFRLPSIVSQTSPVAILLAVVFSLGLLNKYGEITAIKAGGIGLMRVLAPLLFMGLLLSVLSMSLNEYIIPPANRITDSIRKKGPEAREATHFGREGFWLRRGDAIYNIRDIDFKSKKLFGINVYRFERPFRLKERISADSAHFKNGVWVAEDVVAWERSGGGVEEVALKDFAFTELKGPKELLSAELNYEKMGFSELKSYIRSLKNDGYDTSRYRVILYTKISFPLVNLIMVLVGIPFALKTSRGSGLASGIAVSAGISFGYWIIFGIAKSLGETGILPPLVAAVFPDVLFIAIGTLMFGYVRQ